MLSDELVGPSGGQVPCSGCGAILDPLRAGHVAIFSARFHFFCDRQQCRGAFLGRPSEGRTPRADDLATAEVARAAPGLATVVTSPVQAAESVMLPELEVPEPLRVDDDSSLGEPLQPVDAVGVRASSVPPERRDVGVLLVALALIAGLLTMALEFSSPVQLVLVARVVLVVVASGALFGRALTTAAEPATPHRVLMVLPPAAAAVVALWALVSQEATVVSRACLFAGTLVVVTAVVTWLVGLARSPVLAERRWLEQALDVPGRRAAGAGGYRVHLDIAKGTGPLELTFDIEPGQHVVVEAGEIVPVDIEVVEGEVVVLPWAGAPTQVRRQAGEVVVAGGRVVRGQLRGRCIAANDDRVMARPLLAAERRVDVHVQLSRLSRRFAERWAGLVALLAGVVSAVTNWQDSPPIQIVMVVVAVYAALGSCAVGSAAALSIARGVVGAVARGIVYNDASAWDRCARVTTAVFCARGTLLRGEPELVEVEVFNDKLDADSVRALAAGALGAEQHPAAIAFRRATRNRDIAPDPVRNPRTIPGLGVVAVASTGEPLYVGSRALMLERGVSVALAEQRISELEANGRTVVLVAKAGRLMGLLGLQDSLRPGARAAVQYLVDAKIEPVLMSADTRETCEALGRSVDIDHLRPEVREAERSAVVKRIKDTGARVAVLGHWPFDDEPLGAADVSVALASAATGADNFSVSLVSDDVRSAALALALARQTRLQAVQVLALVLAPAVLGSLLITAFPSLLPPEYAPLALLLGTIAAVLQLRGSDRRSGIRQ